MKYEDIAIIGISGRFPEANTLEEFWLNLAASKDSIRDLPETRKDELEATFGKIQHRIVKNGYLDDITYFDAPYFKISAEEAKFLDPQHRISMELIEEAIQSAGYGIDELSKNIVSTFIAFNPNRYGVMLKDHPLTVANSLESALAGRVAYSYNFRGPAVTVDTACSASMIALHQACLSLIIEESDYALVAGCHLFPVPSSWDFMQHYPIFAKSEKLSAFANGADGTLGGEGGGALILKKLSHALRDDDIVYGVIKATTANSDASLSNGFTSPNRVAQTELISRALELSNSSVDDITYFEAHGTGTSLGDPIEVEGVAKAFEGRKSILPIGTVKTNIGHLVGMAGFAGVAKAIMSFKYRQIPESLNFVEPNPHIDFENTVVRVNNHLVDVPPEQGKMKVCVSSFGIIGTNGHAVLEEPPERKDTRGEISQSHFMVPLSAMSLQSLKKQVKNLLTFLQENPLLRIDDIAYTLAKSRRHLKHRSVFIVKNTADLVAQLTDFANDSLESIKPAKLLMIFPPQNEWAAEKFILPAFDVQQAELNDVFENNPLAASSVSPAALISGLLNIGITPDGVLGWGQGRYLADFAKGEMDAGQLAKNIEVVTDAKDVDPTDTIKAAFDKGFSHILRIGHSAVCQSVESQIDALGGKAYAVEDNNSLALLRFIADRYISGASLDWDAIQGAGSGRRIVLPAFKFDRQSYIVNAAQLNESAPRFDVTKSDVEKDLPSVTDVTINDVESYMTDLFNQFLTGEISLSKSFTDNGGDSLAMLDVIDQVKNQYGISISVDSFYDYSSLRELIDHVMAQLGASGAQSSTAQTKAASHANNFNRDDVLAIFQQHLPEAIDEEKSFTDNGGDSLGIIGVVDDVKKHFSIDLSIDDFYEDSSIKALVDSALHSTRSSAVPAPSMQQPAPSRMSSQVSSVQYDQPSDVPAVLITGCTGFLGAHCLHEIIMSSNSLVYCLVRGESQESAQRRFEMIMDDYFGEDINLLIGSRIFVVKGDVTEPELGLGKDDYQILASKITHVLHAAADVRQLAYSRDLEKANVDGTQHVIDFCMNGMNKELHHCSTYVVSGRIAEDKVFTEQDLERGQSFLSNTYARTKYDSEVLVRQYQQQGLRASVYRVGNLTGRFRDGVFQRNMKDNLLYVTIKAVSLIGSYPLGLSEDSIEISPVDLSAKALVKLLLSADALGHTYHLMYPSMQKFQRFFDVLNTLGHDLKCVSSESEFNAIYQQVLQHSDRKELLKGFRLFYSEDSVSDEELGSVRPRYDFGSTLGALNRQGFEWPALDDAYLKKMLSVLNRWDELVGAAKNDKSRTPAAVQEEEFA